MFPILNGDRIKMKNHTIDSKTQSESDKKK